MYTLEDTEIQTLLEILQKVIIDKEEFEQMVAKVLQLKHDIPEMQVGDDPRYKYDMVYDHTQKLESMLQHYTTLLHLLIDLVRQGKMAFHEGPQRTDYLNLYITIQKIIKDLHHRLEPLRVILEKKFSHQPIEELLEQFKYNEQIFLQLENRTIEKIEEELKAGLSLSGRKLVEVKQGKFRVEIHEAVIFMTFANGARSKSNFPYGLQVFDHDYLVAEAGLVEFIPKERIVVNITQTYIKKRAYMQRAIELLFIEKIITEWWSDKMLSGAADQMYWRLSKRMNGEKKMFNVRKNDNRYIVTLN